MATRTHDDTSSTRLLTRSSGHGGVVICLTKYYMHMASSRGTLFIRVCVCVCVRACVRACVLACVCVCAFVCACVLILDQESIQVSQSGNRDS